MAGPDMASITSSLERSFQNCSLNNNHRHQTTTSSGSTAAGDGVGEAAHGEDSAETENPTLELNSEASLPYHWEQCLDLKTGEIYYINWRTGMKSEEDPRTAGDYYYSDDEDDESSSCDESEGSSSESSPPSSSRQPWSGTTSDNVVQENCYYPVQKNAGQNDGDYDYVAAGDGGSSSNNAGSVLVVAGCKSCLMYYMVPKQLEICPKCCGGQLLYFDRSENGSSS